jgi:hypothetical protein
MTIARKERMRRAISYETADRIPTQINSPPAWAANYLNISSCPFHA